MSEQLEDIIEYEHTTPKGRHYVGFKSKKDFNALIQQAEEKQRLERELHLYKLRKENAQELTDVVIKPLQQQNQRYKQALEQLQKDLHDHEKYRGWMPKSILYKIDLQIDQALEEIE